MTRTEQAQRLEHVNGGQVLRLIEYLEFLIPKTIDLGCTCVDPSRRVHEPHCAGVHLTIGARKYLTLLKNQRGL